MITELVWVAGGRFERGWRLDVRVRYATRIYNPACQYSVVSGAPNGQIYTLALVGVSDDVLTDADAQIVSDLCEIRFLSGK